MFLYNITVMVNWDIHEKWLQWQLEEHIPQIMGTGCFHKNQLLRILEIDETDGPTYAVQFYANSKADYNRYIEIHAPGLRAITQQKWGEQCVAFRTLMQVVH
jgi:Domain of unknown function (DUF4286)